MFGEAFENYWMKGLLYCILIMLDECRISYRLQSSTLFTVLLRTEIQFFARCSYYLARTYAEPVKICTTISPIKLCSEGMMFIVCELRKKYN